MPAEPYLTDHLHLATYLLASHQPLLAVNVSPRTTRLGHPLRLFVFTHTATTDALIAAFWKNAAIGVQDFITAQTKLRSLMKKTGADHDGQLSELSRLPTYPQ